MCESASASGPEVGETSPATGAFSLWDKPEDLCLSKRGAADTQQRPVIPHGIAGLALFGPPV